MIDLRFKPLTRWIGTKTSGQTHGPFRAGYDDTLDLLDKNLFHLNARNGVVEAAFRADQIRNDGWPYGKATPECPGVILSFDSKYGALALPCDYFKQWQHNLRAIAFHLEHLRMATIYGVGSRGEQYRGWKAIEAPSKSGASLEGFAGRILGMSEFGGSFTAQQLLNDYSLYRRAYRAAALKVHPDQGHGGQEWANLQEAVRMLDQYFEARGEKASA